MFTSTAKDTGPTRVTKGEATRERILAAALKLFRKKGFEATTLRDIATAADCSPGLAYRYFPGKDDIVLALYRRLGADFEDVVAALPAGRLGERFAAAMAAKIDALEPAKPTFAALFPKMVAPDSPLSMFAPASAAVRARTLEAFLRLVEGSTGVPKKLADDLALLLFHAHFLVLLAWFHDRDREREGTTRLLALVAKGLDRLGPASLLPGVKPAIHRIADVCRLLFEVRTS